MGPASGVATKPDVDVVVVGGGIAGLSAAHALEEQGLRVTVLEAEPEAGGRMRSRQAWDGLWLDLGAEQIVSVDTAFLELSRQFGLEEQRITYLSDTGTAFDIFRGGELHQFDMTRPTSLLRFGAMGWRGKLQVLRLLPALAGQARRNGGPATRYESWRAAALDDRSVEDWLGRLAPEFLEYAMEPVWEVFCGWQPDEISRAFMAYVSTAYAKSDGFTWRTGLGAITRGLAGSLGDVRTNVVVTRVDTASRVVEFESADDRRPGRLRAGAVVVAIPGHLVNGVVDGLDRQRTAFLDTVSYTSHENCFFRLRGDPDPADVGIEAPCFYPRREDGELASMGYGPAPTDPSYPVFRTGLKVRLGRALTRASDDELVAAIMSRVARHHPHIPDLVVDRFLCRWDAAIPMFPVGYLRALADFHRLPPLPGIAFAGDYLAMPATGAAFASGQWAAAATREWLAR